MSDEPTTWGSAARGAVALYVLGLVGVAALAIYSPLTFERSQNWQSCSILTSLVDRAAVSK